MTARWPATGPASSSTLRTTPCGWQARWRRILKGPLSCTSWASSRSDDARSTLSRIPPQPLAGVAAPLLALAERHLRGAIVQLRRRPQAASRPQTPPAAGPRAVCTTGTVRPWAPQVHGAFPARVLPPAWLRRRLHPPWLDWTPQLVSWTRSVDACCLCALSNSILDWDLSAAPGLCSQTPTTT